MAGKRIGVVEAVGGRRGEGGAFGIPQGFAQEMQIMRFAVVCLPYLLWMQCARAFIVAHAHATPYTATITKRLDGIWYMFSDFHNIALELEIERVERVRTSIHSCKNKPCVSSGSTVLVM